LHVEDALILGKLRLFAGIYSRGQGMDMDSRCHSYHFLDLADARVVFAALAQGEPGFSYREQKGSPKGNWSGAVSRILTVDVTGDTVHLALTCGPGKLTPTGGISPSGRPQVEIPIDLTLYEARRLAVTVLAYITACDVHRMLVHSEQVSPPASYPHSPTAAPATTDTGSQTGDLSTRTRDESRGAAAPIQSRKPQVSQGKQSPHPRFPALVRAAAQAVYGSDELRYADGSLVNAGNLAEVQVYQHFVAEKKKAPASRRILQAYYKQRMAA
jgi:hypothetical protein